MEVADDILNTYPDVLTTKQLMEILKIGETLMYKLLYVEDKNKTSSTIEEKKRIRAFKCGKNYRILKSEVIEYMKKQ